MHYQGRTILTTAGLSAIKQEIDQLEAKRPDYVLELTRARDLGDRSENGAYKAARHRLSRTDSRLRYLKKLLENATVVEPVRRGIIDIGSIVEVHTGTKDITYHIVGDHEASPTEGKISYRSPVGHALMNNKAGDTVDIITPHGLIKYTITKIL